MKNIKKTMGESKYCRFRKILLGTTDDGKFIFGEWELRCSNGYPEFSACFSTVLPFAYDEDEIEERISEYYGPDSPVFDKPMLYDMCEGYGCSPQDLPEYIVAGEDARGLLEMICDISYYSKSYQLDGEEIYFESCAGGQHDTRPEVAQVFCPELYRKLHQAWDAWHVKEVDPEHVLFARLRELSAFWSDQTVIDTVIEHQLKRMEV